MQRRGCYHIATVQRGFTLLEIMIVLAIIGLITAAIGVGLYKKFRDAQLKTTQMQLMRIVGDATQYMLMKNKCPTVDDLVTEQYLQQPPRRRLGHTHCHEMPG